MKREWLIEGGWVDLLLRAVVGLLLAAIMAAFWVFVFNHLEYKGGFKWDTGTKAHVRG